MAWARSFADNKLIGLIVHVMPPILVSLLLDKSSAFYTICQGLQSPLVFLCYNWTDRSVWGSE